MSSPEVGPAAKGVSVARQALIALAHEDEASLIDVLNRASHAEAVWAAASLLGCLNQAINSQCRGRRAHARRRLLAAADAMADDMMETEVARLIAIQAGGGERGC